MGEENESPGKKVVYKKVVYVSHYINAEHPAAVNSLLQILKSLRFTREDIIPIAPYLPPLMYLGVREYKPYFAKEFIDELFIAGPKITDNMEEEIRLAVKNGIPISCKNAGLQDALDEILTDIDQAPIFEPPKTAYLAHPVGGDVSRNITAILNIMKDISHERDDIVPIAPYITALLYLDDDIKSERALGIEENALYFQKAFIDEIILAGPTISAGMEDEIEKAYELGIPITCHNPKLKKKLKKKLKELKKEKKAQKRRT